MGSAQSNAKQLSARMEPADVLDEVTDAVKGLHVSDGWSRARLQAAGNIKEEFSAMFEYRNNRDKWLLQHHTAHMPGPASRPA
jgi:hypothetical protein